MTVRDKGSEQPAELDTFVRSLAELKATPHRILSITLDTRWRDEQQRQRVRGFMKEEARRLRSTMADDRGLASDLERAEAIVEERVRAAGPEGGLALYLCGALGIELEVRSLWPLPPTVEAGPHASLRPLLDGLREPARALVAVVDGNATRVYRFGGWGPTTATASSTTVRSEALPRSKRGGWSQLGNQHHRAEQMDHYHKEAAAMIARIFDESGHPRVLLGGRLEALRNLERHLATRVRPNVLLVDDLDPTLSEDRMADVVEAALKARLLEDSGALRGRLEELTATGRGALDLPSVLAALNEERVSRLFLRSSYSGEGWVCRGCGFVDAGFASSCHECGEVTDGVELGEAMARRAVLQAATVESLPDEAGRDVVAAELRYPTLH